MANLRARLYCLARSNPEYLFPESNKLSGKRQVHGRKLAYWWRNTFDVILQDLKHHKRHVDKFWLIPGLELGLLPAEYRDVTEWKFNQYPYTPNDKAMECIAMLNDEEDDAKSKCIKRSVTDASVTVQTFFDGILPASSDFSNSETGLFIIDVAVCDKGQPVCIDNAKGDDETFAKLMQVLNINDGEHELLSFATVQQAITSSQKLWHVSHAIAMTITVQASKEASKPAAVKRAPEAAPVTWLQVKRRAA
jgi:hypothetical protein